jgi:hypothetical protein
MAARKKRGRRKRMATADELKTTVNELKNEAKRQRGERDRKVFTDPFDLREEDQRLDDWDAWIQGLSGASNDAITKRDDAEKRRDTATDRVAIVRGKAARNEEEQALFDAEEAMLVAEIARAERDRIAAQARMDKLHAEGVNQLAELQARRCCPGPFVEPK